VPCSVSCWGRLPSWVQNLNEAFLSLNHRPQKDQGPLQLLLDDTKGHDAQRPGPRAWILQAGHGHRAGIELQVGVALGLRPSSLSLSPHSGFCVFNCPTSQPCLCLYTVCKSGRQKKHEIGQNVTRRDILWLENHPSNRQVFTDCYNVLKNRR
jgi:hypothetical protein